MQNTEKNSTIITILRYFVLLFLILKTQTVFTFFTRVDLHINLIFVFFLALFTFVRLLKRELSITKNKKIVLCLFFYFLFIIFYGVFTKCYYRPYYINYLIVIPLLFFNISASNNYKNEINNIAHSFVNLMCLIAVISLLFYSLGSLSKIIEPTKYVTITWGLDKVIPTYYFLHYDTQYVNLMGDVICRNSSIFTEAPMYSLCLAFALFYHVFFSKNRNSIIILTLVISLITTITFSAFFCLLVIYIMYMLEKFKAKINKKTVAIFILIFIVIVVLTIGVFITRSKTSSIAIRLDDLKATFKAFYNNVIFGVGMNNESSIIKYIGEFRKHNKGLSNTIGLILAQGGIYYTIFYAIPFIGLLNKKTDYKIVFYLIFTFVSLFLFVYFSAPLMFLNISILYSCLYNYLINKKVKK